jgi:pimeloyl-ACP methyl ester carboxylesterase
MNRTDLPRLEWSGSGELTLLLLHGWGLDRASWEPLRRALEAEFEIVAYDSWGSGENDAGDLPASGTLVRSAAELMEVRDRLGRERVIVIGASRGGTVALKAAAEHPERFEAVVAIGAPARLTAADDYPHGSRREDLEGIAQQLELDYSATFEAIAPAFFLTDDAADADRAGAMDRLLAARARTRRPDLAVAILRDNLGDDIRSLLPRIQAPVLLVAGERDPVLVPEAAKMLAERIPRAKLSIVPGAGHVPHITMPEEVAARVRRFIDELRAGKREGNSLRADARREQR